jgi:nucleotide-binding universal stress UspA family protein
MTEWKRICCATDFSDPARVALQRAAGLAGALGCELELVHVVPRPRLVPADLLAASADDEEAPREPQEALAAWRDEARDLLGRPVRATLRVGDPAAELARFVRDGGFDAVVLGTHGRTGLTRLVLGSVAERVVRLAGITVIVARPPSEAARTANEAADYA